MSLVAAAMLPVVRYPLHVLFINDRSTQYQELTG